MSYRKRLRLFAKVKKKEAILKKILIRHFCYSKKQREWGMQKLSVAWAAVIVMGMEPLLITKKHDYCMTNQRIMVV